MENGGNMKVHELVSWFQLKYPKIVNLMKECNHHLDDQNLNVYHLEGDVWCHTMMVLNQLPESTNKVVKIAALLHDIGKPFVREITSKNRVRFLSHESFGAFLSLSITSDPFLELDEEERIQIFKLICLHTEPYKLTSEQLSDLLLNEIQLTAMLRELSIADHNGRFTSIEGKEINFTYKFNMNPVINENKELIMLVGIPASGKSTHALELQKQGYTVISRDKIIEDMHPDKTYDEAYSMVKKQDANSELSKLVNLHRKTNKIVIDMTNLSKSRRSKILNQFPDHNKKCIIFLTDLITIANRNLNREGKYLSDEVMDNMIKSFYLPTYSENFHTIEWRLT